MKINPDALAKIAALQAAQAVDRVLGDAGKTGAAPLPGALAPVPVGPAGPTGRMPSPVPPGTTTSVTLSRTAQQLNGPPPPATLQWVHDVVEALTGLKLPPATPRHGDTAFRTAPPLTPTPPGQTATASTSPRPSTAPTPADVAPTAGQHVPGPFSGTSAGTAASATVQGTPASDTALFTAQGTVYTDDGLGLPFSLQLFADRGPHGSDPSPVVPPVLARMLASHPPMPPLALRFLAPPEQLRSSVFEFQVEPSLNDRTNSLPGPMAGVRLLGLLVLGPQVEAVYNMHVALAAPPDPATVLAAMGFVPGKPPTGKGVWDSASDGLVCDEPRCPHQGERACPQLHCLRHQTVGASPAQ